jgi:hypothetical protein
VPDPFNSALVGDPRKRQMLTFAAVAVLAGVPFLLGKYFEFNSPGAFDSGSYVYSARHVLSGARVGYEEKPSAQAGTLLFNMLGVALFGFSETGSEVLQMLLQTAALVVMFITVRRLYGSLAAVISTTVASVYLSAPLIAKFGNVKEQFMIAFMVLGICCFVYYNLSGKWWWAVLTGALLIWGPMFKQTGLSAIAATGLFVILQPVLHRTNWKRAGTGVLLLVAGAAITMTPICIWYASMGTPLHYWPYSFIVKPAVSVFTSGGETLDTNAPTSTEETAASEDKPRSALLLRLMPGYVRDSWEALSPEKKKDAYARVLRYYKLLILPILLAVGAIVARVVVVLRGKRTARDAPAQEDTGRLVPLLAIWWFFDMAFVWISPRSYEQYYLPLNASGAMLGGYLVGLYSHRLTTDRNRPKWAVVGILGLLVMLVTSWHIFFGISTSPHSGAVYRDPRTQEVDRRRGYLQKWNEVAARRRNNSRGAWEVVGEYIRERSNPNDTIYVWGWWPGIYVEAQRLTSAPKAFEGMMHTLPPEELARRVREILDAFEKNPPKFIVDSRKSHFPWDRPPLELWPRLQQGYLPPNEQAMQQYDKIYGRQLAENIEPAEARRFEAMAPFRRYVMNHYEIVNQRFGSHVLFRRK